MKVLVVTLVIVVEPKAIFTKTGLHLSSRKVLLSKSILNPDSYFVDHETGITSYSSCFGRISGKLTKLENNILILR